MVSRTVTLLVAWGTLFIFPKSIMASPSSEAISKIEFVKGVWEGAATGIGYDGKPYSTHQTERAGLAVSGDIMVIEGKGFKADGSVSFNAFAIVSWNQHENKYEFRAYAQGFAGTFDFKLTSDGYIWEVPAGPHVYRYTATVQNGQWREVGEFIAPGKEPVKIFEMNLKRVGNTDWPSENSFQPNLK
jgi:hypothetical protein